MDEEGLFVETDWEDDDVIEVAYSPPPSPPRRSQPQPSVIDLTAEPDSPVRTRTHHTRSSTTQTQTMQGRNPRRTNSQRISPPTLARSDGTLSNANTTRQFIDLTFDSPPPPPRRIRPPFGIPHPVEPEPEARDTLVNIGYLNRTVRQFMQTVGVMSAAFHDPPTPHVPQPRTRPPHVGLPTFWRDVAAREVRNGMYAEPLALPQAKPPMEPVPAARQGFTRDTKAEGDDVPVVICPCCGECLSYDPEIDVVEGGGGGKKKKQHHFWAVKRCGHVYCSACFENRKPTSRSPGSGFPPVEGRPSDVLCCVEGCGVRVTPKQEWVGIFL